jgi:hypothetical protein
MIIPLKREDNQGFQGMSNEGRARDAFVGTDPENLEMR